MRKILFLVLLFAFPVNAQNYPTYSSVFVNDFAELLDPETEARITALLQQVKKDRGVEMTVVTIESVRDYGDFDAIEPFATGLFNSWGIGNATRNDGILILIAHQDRDMRIELGKGYPPVFDDRLQRIIDHVFLPHFRLGNYVDGLEQGVAETIKRTRLEFTDDGPTRGSRLRLEGLNALDIVTGGGVVSWILGVVAAIFGPLTAFLGGRRYLRNKPRDCQTCGRKMRRLSETDDDAHLVKGQKIEESLKSKDYDVWLCPHDGSVTIEGYRSWFSGYGACPNCQYRTLHSERTTLRSATKSSTGSARVDYNCKNCDHAFSETVTIPKISSSSSSGSSSSFGGGSSSGGGASGSW